MRVPVRQKGKPRVIVQWLDLREIRVARAAARPARAGTAFVDEPAGSQECAGPGIDRTLRAALGTRVLLPGIETAIAQERGAAKPHGGNGRAGNRGGGAGQRALGAGTGAGGAVCDAAAAVAQLPAGRAPAGEWLAAPAPQSIMGSSVLFHLL